MSCLPNIIEEKFLFKVDTYKVKPPESRFPF